MKSPPKMPQRAMVRIWVASLHQELRYPMGTGVSILSALKRGCKGGFEQQRSRPPPAAETGRRGWGSAPLFQSPAKGLRKKRQAQLVRPAEQSGGKKAPVQQQRPLPAAETGRSCWGCGQQDARAAQGTMQPLGAATRAPFLRGSRNSPTPTKKTQRIPIRCGFVFYSSIFTSPTCQSSWARILFCTISPAGVRARVRPSKVAYPARTQFCTKASCAVENCLPYRVL